MICIGSCKLRSFSSFRKTVLKVLLPAFISIQLNATGAESSILEVMNLNLSPTCVPPVTSQIPTTNLQTRYTFTGNMNDASGANNNGVPQFNPTLTNDRFSVPNSAYSFDGVSQWMSTTTAYNNPTTFTIGLWFKTTSINGGGLMGFCESQTTTGFTNRDRVIYMNNSGQLEFGVYPGSIVAIKTPESYNDGYWHFAVATFSSAGMKLYVDGLLKLVNASATTAQSMTGYWRVGHFDLTTGWSTASSNYFNGILDDIFFYDRVLSSTEIQSIYEMPDGAGSDSPKCSGENLYFKGVSIPNATYAWTGPAGFTSALQNPVINSISSANEGVYYLTITDALGCSTAPIPVLVRVPTVSVPLSQAPTAGLVSKYLFKGNSNDLSGNGNTGILQNSPVSAPGRFGIANSAYSFNGVDQYISTTNSYNNPSLFTIAVWFNTTSITGGKLIGFGNLQTGASTQFDRHIYMTNSGQLIFGVNNGSVNAVNTGGEIYNDGQWHCAVGTLSSAGLNLYVDGVLRGSNASVTTAQNYTGYWRIGYGEIGNAWPSPPTSNFFNGLLDDIYIYNVEIPAANIAQYNSVDGAGSNEPFCTTGGTLNLTATNLSGAYSYNWTGPNGFTSVAQNPSISGITSANAGMYSLTVTTTSSCPARAFVNVRIDNLPSAPAVTGNARCGAGTINISANGSPLKYRWYTASSGGSSLAGSAVYSPNISTTTTYYVSAVNATGCESNSRTPVTATINSIPPNPVGSDIGRCGAGSVTFNVSGSPSNYNWYSVSTGGTVLGTGSSYTTPVVSSTTTHYVTSLNSFGCESPRMPLVAIINPVPGAPTGPDVAICGSGTVTLNAAGSPSAYNWYDASTGGLFLGSGPSFTTPFLSATTTYFVSSVNSYGCESTTRTPIAAIINAIPPVPSAVPVARCGSGSVTLTGTGSPANYNWYDALTGGNLLGSNPTYLPALSATTTFYVSAVSSAGCESATRKSVIATVNPIPSAPTATSASRCGTGTLILSASGSPSNYNWYTVNSGGSPVGTGASFTTPLLSATNDYFVAAVSTASCESTLRTMATATIFTIPQDATTTSAERCGTGTVVLNAAGSPSGYNWYTASGGGSPVGTGSSFTTPSISSTTTYFVAALSANNCESNSRTPVQAVVNTIPSAPSSTSGSRCGPGKVTLTGISPFLIFKWYDALSGGNLLGTGQVYEPIISINTTTTFYVSVVSPEGCESITRGSATATVNAIPPDPAVASNPRCGPGTVVLSASGSPSGYNWYTSSSGGSVVGTGTTFTTPSITTSTDYFVSTESSANCESNRIMVTATVNTIPGDPFAAEVYRCGAGNVVLTATGSPSGYEWFDVSSGGSSIGSGSSFTTPSISSTTKYYVSSISSANCSSSGRTAVIANVYSLPAEPSATNGEICGSGSTTLSGTGSPLDYYWYSNPGGGQPIGTGTDFDTPFLTSTTTYYVASVDTNGCESFLRTSAVARVNAVPSIPTATGDSICGAGTANLTASGSVSGYNWYDAPTGDNLLGSSAVYSPSVNANSTFYVCSVINKCESIRIPAQVIVSTPANPGILNSSQTVCSGNNQGIIELTGYTGIIQKWEISGDGFVSDSTDLGNTLSQYSFTNITQTKSYRVKVKSGNCPVVNSSVVTITVDPSLPTVAGVLSKDTLVPYQFNSGSLTLTSYTGSVIGWEISTDNLNTWTPFNGTAPDFIYSNLIVTTSYRAVVQSGYCLIKKSNIVTITVDPQLVLMDDTISTNMNRNYQSGISVLSNDHLGSFYQLKPMASQTTLKGGTFAMDAQGYFSYAPPAEFTGTDEIDYTVCNKKTGIDCQTGHLVFIVKDTVIVYSSLTPNGDGINDSWVIDGIHLYSNNHVKIINRWGDLVYEQESYNNKEKVWKGECNAGFASAEKKLPDGTYFYSIDLSNGSKPLTGYVVIKQ